MKSETYKKIGVDINSKWLFKDGDIELVSKEENMFQAITNRITCRLNALSMYYSKYGSLVQDYLGEHNNPNAREYIAIEIRETLIQDPRIKNHEVKVTKHNPKGVKAHVRCVFYNGDVYEENFILTGDLNDERLL